MMCGTQTCKCLRVVIYINKCTNEGTTQLSTQIKMVSVGQSKTLNIYTRNFVFLV